MLPEPKPTTTRQSHRKTAACITDEDELDKRKELDKKKQSMKANELKQAERQQKQAETGSTRRGMLSANRVTSSRREEKK